MTSGEHLTEALTDLDWANRIDRDYLWIRTSGANAPQFRYMTKDTIDMYADIADFMYVYNPLVKRVVDVKSQFTLPLIIPSHPTRSKSMRSGTTR